KNKKAVVRELQKDPVTDALLHIDFMGIKLDEKIKIAIPVLLTGIPVGVTLQAGILEHPLREVEVEGLPLDIPEHIEIDVSEMEIGDVKTLEDVVTEEKYRLVTDLSHPVAIVAHAKVAKVLEEEEGEGEEGEEGEEGAEEGVSEEDTES
ncbi:50S ribosomal protein L25, partial [bacterium]